MMLVGFLHLSFSSTIEYPIMELELWNLLVICPWERCPYWLSRNASEHSWPWLSLLSLALGNDSLLLRLFCAVSYVLLSLGLDLALAICHCSNVWTSRAQLVWRQSALLFDRQVFFALGNLLSCRRILRTIDQSGPTYPQAYAEVHSCSRWLSPSRWDRSAASLFAPWVP